MESFFAFPDGTLCRGKGFDRSQSLTFVERSRSQGGAAEEGPFDES
jgi:hypothetical protein